MGESMTIRRSADGVVRIQGQPATEHTFSARWLDRHLGDLADVTITINTSTGPTVYRMTGFEPILNQSGEQAYEADGITPRWNFTGLRAELVDREA